MNGRRILLSNPGVRPALEQPPGASAVRKTPLEGVEVGCVVAPLLVVIYHAALQVYYGSHESCAMAA
jgi:hypothetical protein